MNVQDPPPLKEKMKSFEVSLAELKSLGEELGFKIEKLLVDETLPLKYELVTGSKPLESMVACDPFMSLCVSGVTIVGRDNERIRNHQEWPRGCLWHVVATRKKDGYQEVAGVTVNLMSAVECFSKAKSIFKKRFGDLKESGQAVENEYIRVEIVYAPLMKNTGDWNKENWFKRNC